MLALVKVIFIPSVLVYLWGCFLLLCRLLGNRLKRSGEAYPSAFLRLESEILLQLTSMLKSFMFLFWILIEHYSSCFLQFGNLGSLEQHGFAKNRLWSVDSDPSPLAPTNNQTSVDLILKSTEDNLKTWPRRYALGIWSFHWMWLLLKGITTYLILWIFFCGSFELRLRVSLNAGKLTVIPRVRNTDSKAFSFTFALINYLYVSDIRCALCLWRLRSLPAWLSQVLKFIVDVIEREMITYSPCTPPLFLAFGLINQRRINGHKSAGVCIWKKKKSEFHFPSKESMSSTLLAAEAGRNCISSFSEKLHDAV